MKNSALVAAIAVSLSALLLLTQAPCQGAASSPNYVLSTSTGASGGNSKSPTYVLRSAQGEGVVASRSASPTYVMLGGFAATTDVSTAGQPMLTAVAPMFATMNGQASITLHGSGLNLGSRPTVNVGGQTVAIGTRAKDAITVKLPAPLTPGWQPVSVSNSLGKTELPRGIGILPMIYTNRAPAREVPFSLVFKGTQGDQLFWALGIGPSTPIALPGIHYGFALNPAFFLVFSGFGILAADGELKLAFPATRYVTGSIYVQGMFASSNPGYGPAAFSNVIRL